MEGDLNKTELQTAINLTDSSKNTYGSKRRTRNVHKLRERQRKSVRKAKRNVTRKAPIKVTHSEETAGSAGYRDYF